MVFEKIKASQNFGQISRVSQSRILRGSERLAVSNFCKPMWGLDLGLAIQRPIKVSVSQRKTLVSPSRRLAFTICHLFLSLAVQNLLIKFLVVFSLFSM